MREWIWRIKATLWRKSLEAESNEELRHHFDLEVEAGRAQGLSPEEARKQARWKAGLVSEGTEARREEFGFRWLDGIAGDLRHAFRALTRNASFGAMAVLVLGASVAVNTLIFCMLEGVVLRPLPYADPERLVRLFDAGTTEPKFPMSLGHYLDYRANAKSLESIALYTGQDVELSGGDGRPEQINGLTVSTDYFAVLGKAPAMGRAFSDADMRPKVRNVIVSDRFWREHLHANPAVIGSTLRLDRVPWTVVGVAPRGFQHVGGTYRSPLQGESVDVWFPLNLQVEEVPLRAYHYCNAIARIRAGISEEQARQDLLRVAELYAQRHQNFGKWSVNMQPLLREVNGRSRQVVWLLAAAGGLVMLVACANIAGLCVARAVARRKELALRHALGAKRWQLMRVGLSENLLIGLAGASLGLGLAALGLPLLRQLLPADFPRAHEIGMSAMSAAFAAAVSVGSALLAGLLPSASNDALRAHQRVTAGRDSRALRMTLVAGEVALAGLLCAGALFLLRSYQEIGARDHGFRAAGTLTFHVSVPNDASTKPSQVYEEIRRKILQVPGVSAAGASTNLPWSGYDENSSYSLVGRTTDGDDRPSARYQAATPGYFEATGMRLLEGRFFDAARDVKDQPLTVLVNDVLAKRSFPKGDAVGSSIRVWGQARQVVGVVKSVKDLPADLEAESAFWFPLGQVAFSGLSFAVHSDGVDASTLTAALREAVRSVDPHLAMADVRTLERHAAAALASQRFALWLFQAFAALALLLASAGIYGLLAYIVHQRRKEFGIRMALGANGGQVYRIILADGFKMAAAGALLCMLLTPVGGSLLQSFLYNVKAFDLITVVGAPAALLLVALLASLGPARNATRNDPALALRED